MKKENNYVGLLQSKNIALYVDHSMNADIVVHIRSLSSAAFDKHSIWINVSSYYCGE